MHTVESHVVTDVLIVGRGPAGTWAAPALGPRGVPDMVVTGHARLAGTPRARITDQRLGNA
ncbi:hypothetical protein GCM10010377_71440 [Streptomyces viridiviolaceus]|uniref:FAD-dependent monooxygenase n=1 Tax=Streptomyces viridiviolaceus TaxID=68282 RepID=A0ABW2E296_9ACTN|nr:hypothetical protein GCM10010377_71440 [Streptomyces viridiviolaceus]